MAPREFPSPLVDMSLSELTFITLNMTMRAQGEQGLWTKKTVFELGTREYILRSTECQRYRAN